MEAQAVGAEDAAPRDQPVGDRRLLRRLGWPLGVVAVVVLANLPALVGIVDVNPIGPVGHLASSIGPSILPGRPFADLEIGYTAQALGHLAAMDWLHGVVPWWNPFEGIGSPLAAEMQAAAFFPPTLLLALPQGQLLFHVFLESAAGLGTYFLAREIGFARGVSFVGATIFGLNGTFSLFGHAPANPVALLPFMLLGLERLARRPAPDHAGWLILALALALSFYAGFPETTYLEGLFVALWLVVRLIVPAESGRGRFLLQAGLGVGAGLLLTAPLLVAFAVYLPDAYVAGHSGLFGGIHEISAGASWIGLPWLYGPPFAFTEGAVAATTGSLDAGAGGFVTVSVIALGVTGFLWGRRRDLGLRMLLGVGALVVVLWSYGGLAQRILRHVVPLAGNLWVNRYSPPVWELALALLACYGADALLSPERRPGRLAVLVGPAVALGVTGLVLHDAWPTLVALDQTSPSSHEYAVVAVAWGLGTVVVVAAASLVARWRSATGRARAHSTNRARRGRVAASVAAGMLAVDAFASFGLPELAAPRSYVVDQAPVTFLAAHLGDARFFSIGFLFPDYGSYFGLASADTNDLPVPKLWANYIPAHLATNVDPAYFGSHTTYPSGPSAQHELVANLSSYEAIDVRYVLVRRTDHLFGPPGQLIDGVRLVFSDPVVDIYELPHPQPFFSTVGAPCQLQGDGIAGVVARCSGPATLVRDELWMRGWSASVNGRAVPVTTVQDALQGVALPAGTSSVSFAFAPPHTTQALGLFGVGAAGCVVTPLVWRRRRRRRAGRRAVPPAIAAPAPEIEAPAAATVE